MRVISGKYKGRNLIGFDIDGTRPTMDRIKESLFASIQNKLKDSTILDLFAGSGALGIEAISNGGKCCYFVDNNKDLINIIKKNIINIEEETYVINNNYTNALNDLKGTKFDIIFLDPPYKFNFINDCINKIHKYDLLSDNGIIVCEYEKENINTEYYDILKEKKYGSKNIRIYVNNNN